MTLAKVRSRALMALVALALVTPVEAATRTGQYTGNGETTQLQSGLTFIRSLTIVRVAERGQSACAYTTNTIQQTLGNGTFLNGTKRDSGVQLQIGTFYVTNEDFNEEGVVYFWEANGDE